MLADLQQGTLADAANVARATLSKVESGGGNVESEVLARIQEALENAGIEFTPEGEVFGEGLRWRDKSKQNSAKSDS